MSRNDANVVPYVEKKRKIRQASRRINAQEGVVIPVDRYGWISSGVVAETEKGRPLMSESKLSKPFADPNRIKEELEESKQKSLDEYYSFFDINPKSPKFAAGTPLKSETAKIRKTNNSKRPKTGINQRDPAPDIIDSIGTLHLKTVDGTISTDTSIDPLAPHSRKIAKPRIPSSINSTRLVRQQLKRVFQPGITPFRHVDSESSFPLDLFQKTEMEIPKVDDYSEPQPTIESMLIDSSEYDITWDKDGAPFTKSELRMLSKWRQKGVEEVKRRDKLLNDVERDHEHYVTRTFQSKLAFEKHLMSTNKVVDRIVNLGPGKGEKQKDFLWKESSKQALLDPSSLPYRQRIWKRFANAISKDEGLTTQAQHDLVKTLQDNLVAGYDADSSMFWRTLDSYKWEDYLSVPNMCVLEHLRIVFEIEKEELMEFLKTHDYPHEFYKLAPMAIADRQKKVQKIIDDSQKISTFSQVKITFS